MNTSEAYLRKWNEAKRAMKDIFHGCMILILMAYEAQGLTRVPMRMSSGLVGRRSAIGSGMAAIAGLSPSVSLAADKNKKAASTAPESKLVVKELSKPDMSGVVMNALKKGDYIRVDYKIYLDKLGGTLIDSTDKTGPVQFQIGMGRAIGTAGTIDPKKGGKKVPLLPVFDQVLMGNTVGAKYELEVPPELAYGSGATTGIGYEVPAGKTVYATLRIRSRVFAGIVGGEQGTFLEDDNISKFNELLGTTF